MLECFPHNRAGFACAPQWAAWQARLQSDSSRPAHRAHLAGSGPRAQNEWTSSDRDLNARWPLATLQPRVEPDFEPSNFDRTIWCRVEGKVAQGRREPANSGWQTQDWRSPLAACRATCQPCLLKILSLEAADASRAASPFGQPRLAGSGRQRQVARGAQMCCGLPA